MLWRAKLDRNVQGGGTEKKRPALTSETFREQAPTLDVHAQWRGRLRAAIAGLK
jgi:hypothetical protein